MFLVISVAAPLLAMISIMRSFQIGWHPSFFGDVVFSSLMLIIFLFRKHISDKWKVAIIVCVGVAVSVSSAFYFGFVDIGIMYGFLVLVFVSTIFSKKVAIWVGFLLFVLLLIISSIYVFGIVQIEISNLDHYVHSWSAWLLADTVIVFSAVVVLIVIISNKEIVYAALNHLEKKNRLLAEKVKKTEVLANSDCLTGLPNRRALVSLINKAVKTTKKKEFLGVLCVDIQEFTLVNDRYGIEVGDLLLKEFSKRLDNVSRRYLSARMSGDEFMLILPNLTDACMLKKVYGFLIRILEAPYNIKDYKILISINVGAAIYPRDVNSTQELMNASKLAVDNAKRKIKDKFCIYDRSLDAALERKIYIEKNIIVALRDDEFKMFFQPIVNLCNGEIVGQEALLRWENNLIGEVETSEYIKIAEISGQIVEIDFWVIENVFYRLTEAFYENSWPEGKLVSVNISARTLQMADFVDKLIVLQERYQLITPNVVFEITEYVLAAGGRILGNLRQIQKLGFRVSLDDFGTGYSSLSALSHLPIDQVKIDRSFLHDALTDPRAALLMESILMMLDRLSFDIVVEGIENEVQFKKLRGFGFKLLAQGYYFSHPHFNPVWRLPHL